MWTTILVKIITSEGAKLLIALLLKKLLDSKEAGITKEVATAALDAVAKSRANDVPADAFEFNKREYLK